MTELHVIISSSNIEVKHLQPYTINKSQFYRVYVNKTQVNAGIIQ